MNNNLYENDEIEIDLKEIFFAIRKWILVILAAGFTAGVLAFAYTKLLVTPQYTAKGSMLVLTKETTLASLADLQMGSQLTNDYRVLATSRPVLEQVIENLELDLTYRQLEKRITIENPNSTRILNISAVYEDPQMAYDIVCEVANEASAFIGDMMEVVPPKVIDYGVVPAEPTSPSPVKNVAIGILLGFLLSGGIVVMSCILDDTIKSEEDVEKYLDISTLSVVPDRKDYISQNKDKKRGGVKLIKEKPEAADVKEQR